MYQANKTSKQFEISLDKLIQTAAPSARKPLLRLFGDHRVEYIILLQNAIKSRRNYLLAGRKMKFRTPHEVDGKSISGMRMTAFVDLEALRRGSDRNFSGRQVVLRSNPTPDWGCDRVYCQLLKKRVRSVNVGSSLVKTAADRLMHDGLHK